MDDFRWYVARALPGLTATALWHLSRLASGSGGGIREAFSAEARGRPSKGRERTVSLYPGYVFVELDGFDYAGRVNRTRGIHKLLPIFADHPSPLPRGFVEGLKAQIGCGDFDEKTEEQRLHSFVPQDEVEMVSGPFRDHRGRFLRYHKGAGEIIARLLGREVTLQIPLHQLVAVGGRSEPGARSVRENVAA